MITLNEASAEGILGSVADVEADVDQAKLAGSSRARSTI